MKKTLLLCICLFLLLSFKSNAQSKLLTDSTFLSIQKIKSDSLRHLKSLSYVRVLLSNKNPIAEPYAEYLIKDAETENNQKFLGQVYNVVADTYMRIGEYDKAYGNFIKSQPLLKNAGDWVPLIRSYSSMAWIEVSLKQDGADNTLATGLKIAREHDLKGMEAEVYVLSGIINDSRGQFDKAIAAYQNALTVGDKYATDFSKTSTYSNLGISYRRAKRYKEAMESFLKAKTFAEKVKDKYLFQSVYQNMAELSTEMKDYDNAEKYMLLAFNNSKDNNEPVLRRGLYSNLKMVYEKKGDYKKALLYADSVEMMDKRVFDKDKVASVRDLQTKYETALKDQQIQKQNAENDKQKQLLIIGEKQAQIQKISFANKQSQFETDKRLQASLLQKNTLQAQLDRQVSGAQIARQNDTIKANTRYQYFLVITLAAALIIASLIFYNQRKTRALNKVILSQKKDLEDVNSVKDRMFSIIGHDMRAPINTLIAFNTLLDDEELSAQQMKLYSGEIKKTLDNTASMMDNLLNWAGSQMQGYTPDIAVYNLKEIAATVVATSSAQANHKSIKIIDDIPGDISITADRNMTELIVRNLITNAIKFTPKNGTITLNASRNAGQVAFSIIDTGVGMPADVVTNFNSAQFNYDTKSTPGTSKEKGTGLGLLLCKNFVRLMHGSINLKSEPGMGSTFNISLPTA